MLKNQLGLFFDGRGGQYACKYSSSLGEVSQITLLLELLLLQRCCLYRPVWGFAYTRRSANAGLMLEQRRRRWFNIKPALAERLVQHIWLDIPAYWIVSREKDIWPIYISAISSQDDLVRGS